MLFHAVSLIKMERLSERKNTTCSNEKDSRKTFMLDKSLSMGYLCTAKPLVSIVGRRGKSGERPARTHRCNPGPRSNLKRGTLRPASHCALGHGKAAEKGGEARRPASRNVWRRRQIPQALILSLGFGGFLI